MSEIGGGDNVCVPHDAYAWVDILNRQSKQVTTHCPTGPVEQ